MLAYHWLVARRQAAREEEAREEKHRQLEELVRTRQTESEAAAARVTALLAPLHPGENAPVPESMAPGDIIAFLNTGSYIEVYTCNFNALPRPATVLVSGDKAEVIKRAETLEDVFGRDIVPDRLANIG